MPCAGLQRVAASIVLLAAGLAQAGEPPGWRGELSLGYDDNLAQARQGAATREDAFLLAGIGIGRPWTLGPDSALHLQLGLQGQHYAREQGLDQLRAQIQGRLFWNPLRGFHAPGFSLGASVAALEFDSRTRDGGDYRIQLSVSEALTTRLTSRWTIGVLGRRGHAVFDARTRQYALDLDWVLAPRVTLYGGYQLRRGDFVSTGQPSAGDLARVRASAPDDVFTGETLLRQSGRLRLASLGLNRALSPNWALDLQLQAVDAEARSGVHYRRHLVFGGLLWQF